MNNSREIEGLIEEGEAFRKLRSTQAKVTATPSRCSRRFHRATSIAFLVTAFAGFAPTYFLRGLSDRPALSPLLHVHGFVFTSWLVLLFVQTALVSANRVDWHKRLGIAGAVIATSMVPLGFAAALAAGHIWLTTPGSPPLGFLVFPFGQIALFATFVAVALYHRKKSELHRRFIFLATVTTITPAISRIVGHPMLALGLSALFIVAGIVHDWRSQRRVHRVYLWGGLVFLLSGPLRFAIAHSATWERIARSLVE